MNLAAAGLVGGTIFVFETRFLGLLLWYVVGMY
jgi:hypothetical protein